MRIDTNQLRESAYNERMHGNWAFAQLIEMCIQELDRLYALEDATTPFASRAEVETYLKGKGWYVESLAHGGAFVTDFKGNDIVIGLDFIAAQSFRFHSPLAALTPALLDKILEAK